MKDAQGHGSAAHQDTVGEPAAHQAGVEALSRRLMNVQTSGDDVVQAARMIRKSQEFVQRKQAAEQGKDL